MKKYLPAFACTVGGFVLFGPPGLLIGIVIWLFVNRD